MQENCCVNLHSNLRKKYENYLKFKMKTTFSIIIKINDFLFVLTFAIKDIHYHNLNNESAARERGNIFVLLLKVTWRKNYGTMLLNFHKCSSYNEKTPTDVTMNDC